MGACLGRDLHLQPFNVAPVVSILPLSSMPQKFIKRRLLRHRYLPRESDKESLRFVCCICNREIPWWWDPGCPSADRPPKNMVEWEVIPLDARINGGNPRRYFFHEGDCKRAFYRRRKDFHRQYVSEYNDGLVPPEIVPPGGYVDYWNVPTP